MTAEGSQSGTRSSPGSTCQSKSSKLGIRKPDPRIMRLMLRGDGMWHGRIVYLDDLRHQHEACRQMALTTIKVLARTSCFADLRL